LIRLPGDNDYVENSNFLICKIDPKDKPAGTYFEAGYAMKLKIPIYVLQTQARENYSESFVGWVFGSQGSFFENQTQLIEFIKDKYQLKERK
jgi:nucleoside 2-deoxyribosyltransferase